MPRITNGPARLVAAKPAAQEIGIPYTTLRDLAFAGAIKVVKIGRAWYFERSDLNALVEKLKESVAA